jgi:hypothetical protein
VTPSPPKRRRAGSKATAALTVKADVGENSLPLPALPLDRR